jgi:hypothetical protein
VAVVLVGTLIAVYSTIRYDSSQNQSPQILTATDETDSAILKALGFTVGYYGSILQVTGNSTYAKTNATAYMNSALQYISNTNPSWGATLNMTSLNLSTKWFTNSSVSTGQISVIYNLAGLGLYGINYTGSCSLGVQVFNSPSNNQVCMNVTQDGTSPLLTLDAQNFAFYSYAYENMTWLKVYSSSTPTVFTNGTYLISIPNGVDPSAYVVQVTDARGLMVQAASFNNYRINFAAVGSLQSSPVTIELLQNGTMRWLGQNLQNLTTIRPIPPIPAKAFHLSPTGTNIDLPYQIEDWASQYQIPLGLTNNYTVFGNNQMIVFQISAAAPQVTLWWNGSDTATQPSSAFIDTCFTADNPDGGTLTNGNITIRVSYPSSNFQITSTTGSVTSVTNFMRVNAKNSTYGAGAPAYVIHHGVVRDIIQEEAEWSSGITNCSNVYSQIVLTLPANSTYFTYQGRLIFINSAISRNITDVSPIRLTTNMTNPQVMTENGTLNGLPYVSNSSGVFYNYGFSNGTWTPHHWSQFINNSTGQGTGIMFTDAANQQLFAFDPMAGKPTGGLYANASVPLIEIDPVTSQGSVSFASSLDLSWFGAVATFTNQSPIYTNSGSPTGLWQLVEQPPAITETPATESGTSIFISPNTGPVGTSVTVSGYGFTPSSTLTITYNGSTVATSTATVYGAIPAGVVFTVPASPPGSYIVSVTDANSTFASANFTLTTSITITSSNSGLVGSTVTVSGSGFAANSNLTATFSGVPVTLSGTTSTYSNGTFAGSTFTVPASPNGPQVLVFFDSAAPTPNSAQATYTVISGVILSPSSGNVGTSVTVFGIGFTASSPITGTFNGSPVALSGNTTTDATGSFAGVTFIVPASKAGANTVTITDASSKSGSATFTVIPYISLSPTSGNAGSTVTVSGSGFADNSALTATFAGSGVTLSGTTSTNSSGSFTGATFSVPTSTAGGAQNVVITDAGANSANATFTVNTLYQLITVTMSNSAPSATVTVNGGYPSPSTFAADGSQHNITMVAGDSFTLSFSNSGDTRNGFIVSNAFSATSSQYTASTNPISVTAYEQVQNTFSVSFSGGSPGSSDSLVLTGTYLGTGSSTIVTLNSSNSWSTSGWSDYNTAVTFPAKTTLSNSTEQWTRNASYTTSSLITGSGSYSPPTNYYHQYSITFQYSVSGDGSSYSAPTVNYTLFGTGGNTVTAVTSGGTAVWVDAGTTYSYTNPLSGSGSSERWVTGSATGTANASGTVSKTYYHQYQVTPYYTLSDSSSPTVTNVVGYTQFGGLASATPTKGSSGGTAVWADAGSSVTYTSPISGSGQRWQITSADSGTYTALSSVTSSTTTTVEYYHQYSFQLDYAVSGGGAPTAPTLTATRFGSSYTPTLTTSLVTYWLDSGQSWSVTNPLGGSGSNEQWYSSQTVSGTVSASSPTTAGGSLTFTYYHQWKVTFSATGLNSDAGSNTVLTVGSTNYAWNALPSNAWVNSGTSYTWANPVSVSSTDQFTLTSGSSGTVTTYGTISATYQEQFKVTFQQSGLDSSATGTVVTVNGAAQTYSNLPYTTAWINSGSQVTYSYNNPVTSSTTGKRFSLSSVSGPSSPITVTSAATVTGNYVVQWQVTFAVSPSGSGTTNPSGTNVWENQGSLSISASANSGYYFSSWSATTGITITSPTSASTTATINAAGTITATFAYLDHFTVTAAGGGSIGTQTAGTAFSITITAKDASGNTVTGYTGTATLSDLSGTISPTSTTGGFTAGVWTGSVTITKTWTNDVITATGSGKTGQSNQFNVNPGALDHFSFSTISSPQRTGVAFTVTITAQDQYGNTVTSYAGTRTLRAYNLGGGSVNPSSVTFANGVWTGSVTITVFSTRTGVYLYIYNYQNNNNSNTFTVNYP